MVPVLVAVMLILCWGLLPCHWCWDCCFGLVILIPLVQSCSLVLVWILFHSGRALNFEVLFGASAIASVSGGGLNAITCCFHDCDYD